MSVRIALAVALILPLALAACGRKGALDPPPSAATPPPPASPATPSPAPSGFIDPTTPTGEAQPAPVRTTQATPPPQPQTTQPGTSHPLWKSFVLDPLLQ